MTKDWIEIELGDIAKNIQYGYTESSSNKQIGPKFLRITDIQNNNVDWENVPYCRINDDKLPNYILEKGDLLFARTGATVGKSFLIRTEIPKSVFASYLIRVRVNNAFLQEDYLSYFFNAPFYWQQITENQAGIGQPNVNGTKLGKLKVAFPSLPLQRAIVAKLEALFSDLDNGIADLKKAQEQLKIYRQAVLKKAFEGGLTNTKMSIRNISSLSILVTKGASPKWQGFNYINDCNGLLFITSENIREGFISLDKEKYLPVEFNEVQKRSVLQKGDVLFNIVGASIGRAAIFNIDKLSNINQAVALIRLNDEIHKQYVNYFLNSEGAKQEYLKKQVEVARANLSLQNVNDIEIPFCSKSEQQEIIKAIESRLSVCDKVEENINEAMIKSEALRQSILKKAFEGKLLSPAEIEKCKQEADYEPASELLKRIKKEKI